MTSMRVSVCVLAAVLAVRAGSAVAADAATCEAFVQLSDWAYSQVRSLHCGLDPNNDRWKWDPAHDDNYRRFCLGALPETVAQVSADIRNTIGRCRTCSGRADLCLQEDAQAKKYHCAPFSPSVCGAIQEVGRDLMAQSCMNYDSDTEQVVLDQFDTRANELQACIAANQQQIDFCNAYVQQTRDLVRRVAAMHCSLNMDWDKPTSSSRYDLYSTDDDTRFEWCFNLKGRAGDPNYVARDANGDPHDPVQYIKGRYMFCAVAKQKRATTRPKRPSSDDGGVVYCCGKGNGSRGAAGSVGEARSRPVIGPGLLDNDGGLGRNAPGAVGTPPGGGTTNTGRTGGSLNVR